MLEVRPRQNLIVTAVRMRHHRFQSIVAARALLPLMPTIVSAFISALSTDSSVASTTA